VSPRTRRGDRPPGGSPEAALRPCERADPDVRNRMRIGAGRRETGTPSSRSSCRVADARKCRSSLKCLSAWSRIRQRSASRGKLLTRFGIGRILALAPRLASNSCARSPSHGPASSSRSRQGWTSVCAGGAEPGKTPRPRPATEPPPRRVTGAWLDPAVAPAYIAVSGPRAARTRG